MDLVLTDSFLEPYRVHSESSYNDNYYRLPFSLVCDGNEYPVLHITCDEFANEYNYALCYDLEDDDDIFIDERYIVPSCAGVDSVADYVLDLTNYSKDYCWY